MTTHGAASSVAFSRPFLIVVVPVAYLTALALAIMAATSGGGSPVATASLDAIHLKPHRSHPVAHRAPKPERRVASPKPTPRLVAARRIVPALEVPVRTFAPVVSRSAERVTMTPPPPALVVRIASVTTPESMQAAINSCSGPVEILWNDSQWGFHPTEIAEHDYCGGTAFSALSAGQRVQVVGGDLSGTYLVNGDRRFVALGSSPQELDGIGDIALQTCVPGGLILIGLDRIG